MNTLLLVEDDKLLRHTLKENFEKEDFIVFEAALGKRLIEIIKRHDVDVILLDLRLPDGSGLDFITEVRHYTDAPLIIVSGEHDKAQRIKGLEIGADDYVDKPFEMEELIARVKANLRRYHQEPSNENINQPAEQIRFGPWILDRTKFQILNTDGHEGDLTAREFELLDFLITNAGRTIKRDELCEAIREENYIPTPRSIDVKITRIRKKIGDDASNPNIIQTVRGVGYMFNAAKIIQ